MNEEEIRNLSKEKLNKIPLRDLLGKEFISEIDPNLKYMCKLIRKDLRDQKDCVIAITGYPGKGKSNAGSIIAMLIDYNYTFLKNICFIPTSSEIEQHYLNLPMYSSLHIDEASRGLHKQKWYDKVQQKLNQLYDTEREGHFLCSLLLMPRFQNFTENFRNFRIIYWINIEERGLCLAYRRDEDKDAKDPWHLDENYKKKMKKWRGKRIFERTIGDRIRMEKLTLNYWFWFELPMIPDHIWEIYQDQKKDSRIIEKEIDTEIESYKDKLGREKLERWKSIKEMKIKGYTYAEMAALVGCSTETIRKSLREMEAYQKMKGEITIDADSKHKDTNIIFNPKGSNKKVYIPERFNIIEEKTSGNSKSEHHLKNGEK